MKIGNIKSVLATAEQRKTEKPALPKVSLRPAEKIATRNPESETRNAKAETRNAETEAILRHLFESITDIRKQRDILATQTAYLVNQIAERLQKESQAQYERFMAGELAMPELRDHYKKIEALTDQGAEIFDKIQHVELHGKLPEEKQLVTDTKPDAGAIKYEIRRLDDLIHKTEMKISGKQPKNPSRLAMWKVKLEQAKAKREDLRRQLKNV